MGCDKIEDELKSGRGQRVEVNRQHERKQKMERDEKRPVSVCHYWCRQAVLASVQP